MKICLQKYNYFSKKIYTEKNSILLIDHFLCFVPKKPRFFCFLAIGSRNKLFRQHLVSEPFLKLLHSGTKVLIRKCHSLVVLVFRDLRRCRW